MKFISIFDVFICIWSCNSHVNYSSDVSTTDTLAQPLDIAPNHKEVLYYDGGQIKYVQEYYNDLKHGIYKNWYENGTIRTMGFYYMGFRKGLWSWYNEKGKVEFQVDYDRQMAKL